MTKMKLIRNTIEGRWSILSLVVDGLGWTLFVFALPRFALAFNSHLIDIASGSNDLQITDTCKIGKDVSITDYKLNLSAQSKYLSLSIPR
jgi:hypothetical protein